MIEDNTPSYYILIASDLEVDEEVISSPEVIAGRLKKNYWPLGEYTRHRASFQPGDNVIIYAAGSGGSTFRATATLTSEAINLPYARKSELEYKYDWVLAAPFGLRLDDVAFFPTPVSAKELLSELSFTQETRSWGTYFRGGARQITEADYKLILSEAGCC